MKNSFLNILEKHTFIKWVFFIAAFIGAVTTIFTTGKALYSFFEKQSKKYENIEKIELGVSIGYLKTILGEPNVSKECMELRTQETTFDECQFPKISKYKYIFEKEDYLLYVLTDKNNLVSAYSIYLKNFSFNPTIKIFLTRFIGEMDLILGKTYFSEFENLNEGFLTSIEEYYFGNNSFGYFKLIFSDDYASNYSIMINTVEDFSLPNSYIDTGCDFSLLDDFEDKGGEMLEVSEEKKARNLSKFKKQCPIQSISVIGNQNLDDVLWQLESKKEREDYLKKQIFGFNLYFPGIH